MNDTNKARRNAVRGAWKNEKAHVRAGQGTRDWSPAEQRQIIAKGRANGYEGHHMKSVSAHQKHAGNPSNIQFLNHSEHINGAHKGNTQNETNGYYNPKTGTMQGFGNSNPKAPQSQPLSIPLTQRQQNNAEKAEQARKAAARQARAETKQAVNKTIPPQSTQSQNTQQSAAPANQSKGNKAIESMRARTTNGQQAASRGSQQVGQNKAINAARGMSSSGQSGTAKSSAAGKSATSNGSLSGASKGGQNR